MMTKFEPRRYGIAAIAFGLAGTTLYLLMVNVTLAHIQALSDQIPFDMRPFGYTAQDAARLLGALGEEGRKYYITRQIPLDTIYPVLLAMTLVSTILWLGSCLSSRKLVRAGIVLSLSAAIFDYAENFGVAVMILAYPNFSKALVYVTSTASITKACSTIGAVTITICLAVIWIRQQRAKLHI